MDDGIRGLAHNPIERSRRWRGFRTSQWVVLGVLGGLLLAIGATLILVLRSGMARPALSNQAAVDATPDLAPGLHASETVSSSLDLYWPPNPQPLAPADAPGNRLWWDTRFAYRRAIPLDPVAQRALPGTRVEVLWDGKMAVREAKARADGADVRIAYWDGQWSYELPRTVWSSADEPGWRISFALVGDDEGVGRYHLYYGRPEAAPGEALSFGESERAEYALALALGPQEEVEWGPTVTWTAHSTATQTLVSPDGRLVFEHPAGALDQDVRVRLRIVPESERRGFGSLPDYEFHVEPSPGGDGLQESPVVRWDPPVTVSINWAGLPVVGAGPTWAHFRYDEKKSTWSPVPIEFDAETGMMRFTTDQP